MHDTRKYGTAVTSRTGALKGLQRITLVSFSGEIDDLATLELPVADVVSLSTRTTMQTMLISPRFSLPFVTDGYSVVQPSLMRPTTPAPVESAEALHPAVTQTKDSASYLGLMRNLLKNSGVYALSSLASPLVSLLLLPFLTRRLSPPDYGALAVLDTVIALAASITTLGLDAVFTRVYSVECKTPREQLDALSTLTLLLLLVMLPLLAVGVMAAPWLSVLLLGKAVYAPAISLAVALVLLQNMALPGLMWLRVEGRATLYSLISVANCLLVAGATLLLVGMQQSGIMGALIATGLGNALIAACTLPIIFLRAGLRLRSTLATSMLALGIPYAMNYVTTWVLQVSDRYLLGHFVSLPVVASYAIAYSLGSAVAFVITRPFSLAWWVVIYPIARRDDAAQVFKLIFRWYSFALLFATFGLALFGADVLDLLFPLAYHGQPLIMSIIGLSLVFNSIFIVFNLGMNLKRKTWLAFTALLISSLLNLSVNLLLIPLYGALGAAIATLVAYVALAAVGYLFNHLIYPVPFEVGLFLLALVIGFALYIVDGRLTAGQDAGIVLSIHLALLLLYGGFFMGTGLFPERRRLFRALRRMVRNENYARS